MQQYGTYYNQMATISFYKVLQGLLNPIVETMQEFFPVLHVTTPKPNLNGFSYFHLHLNHWLYIPVPISVYALQKGFLVQS